MVPEILTVSIDQLDAPQRSPDHAGYTSPEEISGFRDEASYLWVKNAIESGVTLPPIEVFSLEKSSTGKYRVRDGYHRYHISKFLGLTEVTVKINDFEFEN